MRQVFLYIVFLTVLLLGNGTRAEVQNEVVKVGIFNFPPFYTKNRRSQAEGLLVDFASLEFKKAGLIARYEISSAARLVEKLGYGAVDVAMLIRHPALIDKAYYSKKPLSKMKLVAYRNQNTSAIKSFNGLANQRVLTLRGYGYGGALKQLASSGRNPIYIVAKDIEHGLDMLAAGRADYFLTYLRPAQQVAAKKQNTRGDVRFEADVLTSFDVFWVVSKSSTKADLIVKSLGGF